MIKMSYNNINLYLDRNLHVYILYKSIMSIVYVIKIFSLNSAIWSFIQMYLIPCNTKYIVEWFKYLLYGECEHDKWLIGVCEPIKLLIGVTCELIKRLIGVFTKLQ